MRIGQKARLVEVEFARLGVDIVGIDLHTHHLGQEHIVRTQLDALLHAALDSHRRLGNQGCRDMLGSQGCEPHLAEFVVIAATAHATPIGGTSKPFGRQVDDKLARAADQRMRVSLLAHRDIAHRRVGADRACPGDGQHIPLLGRAATGDQDSRQGIDQSSGFEFFAHNETKIARKR